MVTEAFEEGYNSTSPFFIALLLRFNFFAPLLAPANWRLIIEYAATLAALGAIDTLLTSIVADNITKTKHDSNRELLGQGIGIIDYKGIRNLRVIPRTDAMVMIVVLLLTVFVGLLEAVAVGMLPASLLFMKAISDVVEHRMVSAPLAHFSREIYWSDEAGILERIGNKVYIKHLDGPLFFGFAARFQEMIKALPDIKVVIFRMEKVLYMDQSGLYALEEAILDLQAKGIKVVFSGLQEQPRAMLESIKIIPELVGNDLVFEDFSICLPWLYGFVQSRGYDVAAE